MVCDDFSLVRDPDAPAVKLNNLQIINGCQTTATVRSAFEDGKLSDNVRIQLKVYASKDASFVDSVVIATNHQNPIASRDLYANDEVQHLIQRTVDEKYGLFYERKRGEAKSSNVPRSRVISMERAGQAFLAVFKRQPTVSRAQKYKIFSTEYYSDIFEKGQPWQLVTAHELHKFVESRGRKAYKEMETTDPERGIFNYGIFHITRIVWWVLERRSDVNTSDSVELVRMIREEGAPIEDAFDEAQKILRKIVRENNASFVNLSNYFKKSASQSHINSYLDRLQKA
jgi:AIPR protein